MRIPTTIPHADGREIPHLASNLPQLMVIGLREQLVGHLGVGRCGWRGAETVFKSNKHQHAGSVWVYQHRMLLLVPRVLDGQHPLLDRLRHWPARLADDMPQNHPSTALAMAVVHQNKVLAVLVVQQTYICVVAIAYILLNNIGTLFDERS